MRGKNTTSSDDGEGECGRGELRDGVRLPSATAGGHSTLRVGLEPAVAAVGGDASGSGGGADGSMPPLRRTVVTCFFLLCAAASEAERSRSTLLHQCRQLKRRPAPQMGLTWWGCRAAQMTARRCGG